MARQWTPIPGYEGVYWITPQGEVKNASGQIRTPIGTYKGGWLDLRNNGQRERVPVQELLTRTYGGSYEQDET